LPGCGSELDNMCSFHLTSLEVQETGTEDCGLDFATNVPNYRLTQVVCFFVTVAVIGCPSYIFISIPCHINLTLIPSPFLSIRHKWWKMRRGCSLTDAHIPVTKIGKTCWESNV